MVNSPLEIVGSLSSEAQRRAHSKADPKGVNAKHKPGQYGSYLEWAWSTVLPSLAPSEGNKDKLKKLVEGAYDKAKKEGIGMNKALASKAEELGLSTPSEGPPPPVPGKVAPAKSDKSGKNVKGGASKTQRSKIFSRANKYVSNGMDRSKAMKKARSEVLG